MSKLFTTSGMGSAQTLSPAQNTKEKVYADLATAEADIANIAENEFVDTLDEEVVKKDEIVTVSRLKTKTYTATTGTDQYKGFYYSDIDVSDIGEIEDGHILNIIAMIQANDPCILQIKNMSHTHQIRIYTVSPSISVTVYITYIGD
jgi:hypothetical protein